MNQRYAAIVIRAGNPALAWRCNSRTPTKPPSSNAGVLAAPAPIPRHSAILTASQESDQNDRSRCGTLSGKMHCRLCGTTIARQEKQMAGIDDFVKKQKDGATFVI